MGFNGIQWESMRLESTADLFHHYFAGSIISLRIHEMTTLKFWSEVNSQLLSNLLRVLDEVFNDTLECILFFVSAVLHLGPVFQHFIRSLMEVSQ
jgi:hypothetical protein